jgi:hypothetical protein
VVAECDNPAHATIQYNRDFTPLVHKIKPRVLFAGAHFTLTYNAESIPWMVKSNIDIDDHLVINVKIGKSISDMGDIDTQGVNWITSERTTVNA